MEAQERRRPDVTLQQLLQWGTAQLRQAGIPDAAWDAWYLLEYVTQLSRADFFLRQTESVIPEWQEKYREYIGKRCSRIPLQYLTGEQEFMGLSFLVNHNVLIPRQDTECLVELVLPVVRRRRVLDVCTGSGCIAISLAALGGPVFVEGVDISREALDVAKQNARRLQAEVLFRQSNLFENVTGQYDVIVCNPPYIPPAVIETLMPEVKDHEPQLALDGGTDGLDFYRRIAADALAVFGDEGSLFLEIGWEQGAAVTDILRRNGYSQVQVHQDLAGKDRVVQALYRRKGVEEECLIN